MARRSEGLTPRQLQSQQIMREKTARKKRKALIQKVYLIGGGILSVTLMGSGVWLWKTGQAAKLVQAIEDRAYGVTVNAGFSVDALYLEGRNRTSMAEINQALGIKKGDPILRISLNEVRARLEAIESVKFAAVERALPGTIHVRIVEREPVALWQNRGKVALVDDQGVAMNGIDIAPYQKSPQKLPLIIGEDAPKHVGELMAILGSEPELAKRFSSAILISDRRWNIRLNIGSGGDVEVRLPETNPSEAWKKLADLQLHQQVLDRDVKVIDLRLEGKMFIKLTPEDMPAKTTNARET